MGDRDYVLDVRVATESDDAALEEAQKKLKELAKEEEKHSRRLRKLLDDLEPLRAAQDRYRQSLKDLTHAYVEGTISEERYLSARKALFERHQQELTKFRESGDKLASRMPAWAAATLKWIGGLAIVHQTLSFLRSSFGTFLEGEQSLRQYDVAATTFAGARKEDLPILHEWISAFEHASGVTKEEALPAFNDLIAATQDMGVTFDLMEVAAGFAGRGFGTLEGNATDLATVMTGRTLRGTGAFTRALQDAHAKTGDWGKAIQQLVDGPMADAGAAMDEDKVRLDRAKLAWQDTKEAVGGLGKGLVGTLAPGLKVVSYGLAVIIATVDTLITGLRSAGTIVMAFGRSAFEAMQFWKPGSLERAKAAWSAVPAALEDLTTGLKDRITGMMDGVVEAWDTSTQAIENKAAGVADAVNAAIERANLEARLEAERKALEEHRKIEQMWTDINRENAEERAEIARKEYGEKVKLDQMWDEIEEENEEEREEEARKRYGLAIQVEELLSQDITKLQRRNLERYRDLLKELLQSDKLTTEQRLALSEQLADAEDLLERRKVASKRDTWLMIMADMASSLQGIFGESKELALAETLISTYAAIAKAIDIYGPTPMGFAAALAAGLHGFAQFRKIQATELGASSAGGGGGSGSSGSGAQAVTPGTGWAGAQSPTVNRRPPGTAPVSTTTVTNQQYQLAPSEQLIINVNALTGAEGARAAREVARRVNRGNRGVNRSLAWSEPTRIGSRRSR